MPDVWMYVFGGTIVAILILTIGYTLFFRTINYSQKQEALNQFLSLTTNLNIICLQEVGNSLIKKFVFPFQVRVIYATDDTITPLPKVLEEIKNQKTSSGKNICMQFKDEQFLRCYPEPPKSLSCRLVMPHIGVLPEQEDIFVTLNKILGRSPARDYVLLINKTAWNEVTIKIV